MFGRAWACAVLLGMASQDVATTPGRVGVTVSAVAALISPRPALLLALAVAYVVHFAVDDYAMPYVHVWLVFLVSSAQAIALLGSRAADERAWRAGFVRAFAPVSVALAGLCFFAAGFAKLNTSFSDPEVSCGAIFYEHQRTVFPFSLLPGAPWAERGAIHFTQVAETLGGLLMLHPRTRKPGFVLSWAFLFSAGTNPIGRLYEFTAPFMAMATLGFSWRAPAWRAPRGVRVGAIGTLVVAVALAAWADGRHDPVLWRYAFARGVFAVAAVGLVAGVVARGRALTLGWGGPGLARFAWAVVVVAFAHETLPYLGVRTARNFCMAANLTVNTRFSNHLLVRHVPELPFNRLAVLERSTDKVLDARGRRGLVDWVLFDELARHPKTRATFELDGERIQIGPRKGDERVRTSLAARMLPVIATQIEPGPVSCGKERP